MSSQRVVLGLGLALLMLVIGFTVVQCMYESVPKSTMIYMGQAVLGLGGLVMIIVSQTVMERFASNDEPDESFELLDEPFDESFEEPAEEAFQEDTEYFDDQYVSE